MFFRDALRVLLHGLPPAEKEITVVTDTVIIPENADFVLVYKAALHNNARSYRSEICYPSWEGAYFRTCKEAFVASKGAANVTAVMAYVRGDTILEGGFSVRRFYEPPDPDEPIGDPYIEGAPEKIS